MSARVMCQCCGQWLVPKADGTSRRHGTRDDGCPGSGYRLALWPDGQRLEHYTGQVWEVVDSHLKKGWGIIDYTMRCVVQTIEISRPVGTVETFHAEYLHRHGWTPVVDLAGDLQRSLERAGGASARPPASAPDGASGAAPLKNTSPSDDHA